jgi:hypothetical protein
LKTTPQVIEKLSTRCNESNGGRYVRVKISKFDLENLLADARELLNHETEKVET